MSRLALETGNLFGPEANGPQWVELASRENDGLRAILMTLGEIVVADTPARVVVAHVNGVSLQREGALREVAPVYEHPMVYVSQSEAEIAYPPAA